MQKNKSLKVSVIIPIYNAMPFLEECIRSVINQTYKNIEIILVDDGSTDGGEILCDRFQQSDARIRTIHKSNEGLVTARKIGIEHVEGDYFVFVDADDEIDRQEIEILCNKAQETDVDMILFGLVEEGGSERLYRSNVCKEGKYNQDDIQKFIIPNMISTGIFFNFGILPNFVCKFIRRDFFNNILVNVSADVTFGEDADMSYQVIPQARSLYVLEAYPYHYKKRSGSMVWKGISGETLKHLENDLVTCFRRLNIYDVMKKQLDEYMLYARLLKAPSEIIDLKQFNGKKVALYGAGGFGQAIYFNFSDMISIWVDRDYEKYNMEGLKVEAVQTLIRRRDLCDMIFIAILNVDVCEKIANQLHEMGVKKQICFYRP